MKEKQNTHFLIGVNKLLVGAIILVILAVGFLYYINPESDFGSKSRRATGWHLENLGLQLIQLQYDLLGESEFDNITALHFISQAASLHTQGNPYAFQLSYQDNYARMHELLKLRRLNDLLAKEDEQVIDEYLRILSDMRGSLLETAARAQSGALHTRFQGISTKRVKDLSEELNNLSLHFLNHGLSTEVEKVSEDLIKARISNILGLTNESTSIESEETGYNRGNVVRDGKRIASFTYSPYTGDLTNLQVVLDREGVVTSAYYLSRAQEFVETILGPDFTAEFSPIDSNGYRHLVNYYYKGLEITGNAAIHHIYSEFVTGQRLLILGFPPVSLRNSIEDVDLSPSISLAEARDILEDAEPYDIRFPVPYREGKDGLVIMHSALSGEYVLAYRIGLEYVNAITGELEIPMSIFQTEPPEIKIPPRWFNHW